MKEKLKMLGVMMALVALVFALPVLAEGQDGQEAVLLDLTKLAQAVISLAAGIVSLYLVPWLRSKLTNEQLSKAKSWVQIAVYAAEKLYGAGNGIRRDSTDHGSIWHMRRRYGTHPGYDRLHIHGVQKRKTFRKLPERTGRKPRIQM